jgi:ATP-dependent exoDNAse (exonuclease V) beta subunit
MSLSDRQLNAAHRLDQDVCVVAGPGSGKTSVLIERFSWLVQEKGIKPDRLLAITFTEKAATEIKQRLVNAFADNPSVRESIERAYVSTIHAFCTRLLKENAIAAGIDPLFEVADQAVSGLLMREATDEVLESIYAGNPERMRGFLNSLAVATERDGHVPDLASSLIEIYGAMRVAGAPIDGAALEPPNSEFTFHRLKNLLRDIVIEPINTKTASQSDEHARFSAWAREMLDLPAHPSTRHFRLLNARQFNKTFLMKNCKVREHRDEIDALIKQLRGELLIAFYSSERALIVEALQAIDVRFRAMKAAQSLLDFADLETCAVDLLQGDAPLQKRIQSSFDYVLMDELQDTNPLQWKLLDLLRSPDNFFAVGDINQSIFRFRHAEPELFRGYQNAINDAGQIVDELRDNYRSRSEVLSQVNHVFDGNSAGIVPHVLTGAREFPDKSIPSIEVIGALAEVTEDAARIEATWIAKRITELAGDLVIGEPGKERHAAFSDIAILTRTNAGMAPIQRALEEYRIPFILIGGRTFFEVREVKDLHLLLRTLVNPCDEVALAGVLRSPLVGLSDESLWRLRQLGPIHRAFAAGRFAEFDSEDRKTLEVFHRQLAELRVMRDSISPDRLLRRVIDDCDYESALTDRGRANLEKFLNLIRSEFKGSLSDLLEKLANLSPEAEAPPSDFGNAVQLMTIHKSKGLEFPIVFLPALHKGIGNGLPIITYAHGFGLGVKWRDPDDWNGVGDTAYGAINGKQKAKQYEEDRRLLYVAMTRAKEHMVLSFARGAMAPSEWVKFICTRFAVATDLADNQVTVRNGVRILVVDQPPELEVLESVPVPESKPVILNQAIVDEQFDSSATVSSVSLFAACPRKYYLSRYLRWESRTPADFDLSSYVSDEPAVRDLGELDASEFGLQVHSLLSGVEVSNPDPGAVSLAARFHASELGRDATRAEKVEREFDFVMEMHNVVLRGQIDLWFERKGKITIVDYKTDQVTLPIDENRRQAYALQLQIYALAIQKLTGRLPDHAWLYFLRPDHPLEIDLSPLQLAAAREAVLDLRDAQDTGRFPLREGAQCTRCEFYQGLCPAGRTKFTGPTSDTFRLPSSFEVQP